MQTITQTKAKTTIMKNIIVAVCTAFLLTISFNLTAAPKHKCCGEAQSECCTTRCKEAAACKHDAKAAHCCKPNGTCKKACKKCCDKNVAEKARQDEGRPAAAAAEKE
jgi:hypothetical protein